VPDSLGRRHLLFIDRAVVRTRRGRADKPISTARQGFDPTLPARLGCKRFAQRRNLNRQIAFFDDQA